MVPKRKDQPCKHLLEADRMKVKMLGRIAGIKAPVGKVQPPINVDCNGVYAFQLQRIDDPRSDIAFSAAVDPSDRSQDTPLGRS